MLSLILWWVSLALAGGSVFILMGLITARYIAERRDERLLREHQAIMGLLITDAEASPPMQISPKLLARKAVNLMEMVKGQDREALVAKAERLGVVEHLQKQLRGGNVTRRAEAAQALGLLSDEQSRGALFAAMDDRDRDVRLAAALALAERGEALAPRILVKKLKLDEGENSRLVVALFRVMARDDWSQLLDSLSKDELSPKVRSFILEALAAAGNYQIAAIVAQDALRANLEPSVLTRLLRVLSAMGHPVAQQAVAACLHHPEPGVRIAAARAAGSIGLYMLAPDLAALLEDADWWCRFRAAEALFSFGEAGQGWLRDIAAGGQLPASEAAAQILAEKASVA